MQIVVIGAGIVGTPIAYSLWQRGHHITLLDRGQPGGGTTSTSYAWVNSHRKRPPVYQALNWRGLEHWRGVIAQEFGEAVGLNGHLEIAVDPGHQGAMRERVRDLRDLGYAAELIDVEQAGALAPLTCPPQALAARYPDEAHAYPARLIQAMLAQMGPSARFALRTGNVGGLRRDPAQVLLAEGPTLSADVVVVAAGNGTPELLASIGVDLPLVSQAEGGPAFGYLGYVDLPGHGVEGLVTTDALNLRPNGPDHMIVQALDLDGTAGPSGAVADQVRAAFADRLAERLPAAQLGEVRVGHRVMAADGLTVAGPIGPGSGPAQVWVAMTHSGVTLGPLLGQVLAAEITDGVPDPLLAAFRPSRFTTDGVRRRESAARLAPRMPGQQ